MTQRHFFTTLFVSALLLVTACSKEQFDDLSGKPTSNEQNANAINTTGETGAISYSLSGVTINPDVVAINEGNALVTSDLTEITGGILKLSALSEEITASLNPGAILYVQAKNFTALQKITEVKKSGNIYLLSVEQAQLGEVIQEGTINMSVDLNKASNFFRQASDVEQSYYHEINLHDEYDLGDGVKFNPATDLKLAYSFKLTFIKDQVLPSEFTNTFELQVDLNPILSLTGSLNKIGSYELTKYIPASVLDYIKSIEIDYNIPINTLGIESLPAKIRIKDIYIPLELEANLSNQSILTYGLTGSFKLGYTVKMNGPQAQSTGHFESTFTTSRYPSISDVYGELLTNSKIIIEPTVTILNGAYTAGGNVTAETITETYGNIVVANQPPVSGSKAVTKITGNILVNLLVVKFPVTIINQEIEHWNIGKIVKSVIYSDLAYKVSSSYSTNVLTTSRVYTTDFTLKYKYPIIGKRVPSKLFISYDVYTDNGTSKITSVTDHEITPADVTADSFKFQLGIPFRLGGLLLLTPQSKSYLKNIVIRDNKGYVYNGIFNSSTNKVEDTIEIKR